MSITLLTGLGRFFSFYLFIYSFNFINVSPAVQQVFSGWRDWQNDISFKTFKNNLQIVSQDSGFDQDF